MRLAARIFTTMAMAALLLPALYADDAPSGSTTVASETSPLFKSLAPSSAQPPLAQGQEGATISATRQWSDIDTFVPKVELFLGYSFWEGIPYSTGNRVEWMNGGTASLAFNLTHHVALVGDFVGYHADRFVLLGPGGVGNERVDAEGNIFTFLAGPRVSARSDERLTPFAQILFGAAHATPVTFDGCSGSPLCTALASDTAFAMTAGVGVDLKIHHSISIRLVQAEYLLTRFRDLQSLTGQRGTQNNMRISTGVVFGFGGHPPAPEAHTPIASCSADPTMVYMGSGDIAEVRAEASDPRGYPLSYSWTVSGGAVEGSGPGARWNSAGVALGVYTVTAHVDNGRGGTSECSVDIHVQMRPDRSPTITCSADHTTFAAGDPVVITAIANDPDNDPLAFNWTATGGRVTGSDSSVRFNSSALSPGAYIVTGHVDDGRGGTAVCSVNLSVQTPLPPPEIKELEGRLALHSIYFPTDRPSIANPDGGLVASQQNVLLALATDFKRYLTFKPDARLTLGGHADHRGSQDYNKALGERRVARTKAFLVQQGVPETSIDTQSFGKDDNLTSEQVKALIEENPDLNPPDRDRVIANLEVVRMANNRRVDVSLSTTGQTSIRQYPFNAQDSLTLLSPVAGRKATMHPARKKAAKP